MSAFDKIIGYEPIKKELLQIVDMIRSREVYEELGAKLPRGVLLYGDPGLGKTLMAKCFIEASGLPAYVVRRTRAAMTSSSTSPKPFKRPEKTRRVSSFWMILTSSPTKTAVIATLRNMWLFSPASMK